MSSEIDFEQEPMLKDILGSEGVQFGMGVFETMRILPSGIEDFHAHLTRLIQSAGNLAIKVPSEFQNLEALQDQLEAKWGIDQDFSDLETPIKVLKLTLFKKGCESRWMVTDRAFPYSQKQFEDGFALCVSRVLKNSTSVIQRHKTLNYAENWMEKQKAIENGYQEVLFLNEKLEITETSASNIFFMKNSQWMTPDLKCGLLNGIMRQRVIAHFKALGKPVDEGKFSLEDLRQADQVFITNALMGLMPVKTLNEMTYNTASLNMTLNGSEIDPVRLIIK